MSRTTKKTISVLLADAHAILLDSLRALLEAQDDLKVVGRAVNGEEAVRLARLRPDVAIVDISMPVMNGIEVTRQIRETSPSTAILILSAHGSPYQVDQALRAGAAGYVVKQSAGPELVKAVRTIIAGKRYLSDSLVGSSAARDPLRSLTAREREVLQLIVEGRSNAAAGSILGLSPRSVETYRARLMQKLGIDDLPTLVKFAIRHGITTLE
jgi:DNA-binding NarL/FixJ family response regulator